MNAYQLFQAVDMDRSGKIDHVELQTALSSGGMKFNEQTARLLIGMFDQDRSGTVNIQEFQGLYTYVSFLNRSDHLMCRAVADSGILHYVRS